MSDLGFGTRNAPVDVSSADDQALRQNHTLEVHIMYQAVRHNLVRLPVFRVLALVFAVVWGLPFLTVPSAWGQQATEHPTPNQVEKASATFTGTVTRDGSQFVLRDAAGITYGLDDTERAKIFEGKSVKVTGQLDQQSKMIHVESIEAAAA